MRNLRPWRKRPEMTDGELVARAIVSLGEASIDRGDNGCWRLVLGGDRHLYDELHRRQKERADFDRMQQEDSTKEGGGT
jgi:hypothetical protein